MEENLESMEKPFVSIIVPVYNTEEYLEECLNCLVNQTLENIEIICINDASTDNSLKILNDFSKNDDRIIIISNETNQGLSITRNRGIKAAKGEYIVFFDSDDLIEKELKTTKGWIKYKRNNLSERGKNKYYRTSRIIMEYDSMQ